VAALLSEIVLTSLRGMRGAFLNWDTQEDSIIGECGLEVFYPPASITMKRERGAGSTGGNMKVGPLTMTSGDIKNGGRASRGE